MTQSTEPQPTGILFQLENPICEDTVEFFTKIVQDIQDNSQSRVYILLDCPGGCIKSAMAIINQIRELQEKAVIVTTIVTQECCSAATLIFLAGSIKVATKNATLVFHTPTSSMQIEATFIPGQRFRRVSDK